MSKVHPTTNSTCIERTERNDQIMQMRLKDMSYKDIGKHFGISASACCQVVQKIISDHPIENLKELRHKVNLQIDMLLSAVINDAMAGDLKAHQQALNTIDRKCKLNGLYSAEESSGGGSKGNNVTVNLQMNNMTKNPNIEVVAGIVEDKEK